MTQKVKSYSEKAQSLVEVLVSLSIATVVLSAITLAVVYSLRNTQFSKNQNLASQYAAEGMEVIRQISDDKSTLASFTDVSYCLGQDSLTLSSKGLGCGQNVGPKNLGSTNYIYIREVTIEPPGQETDCKTTAYQVTVTVSWWDNVCGQTSNFCHKVNLVSCLPDRKNTVDKLL